MLVVGIGYPQADTISDTKLPATHLDMVDDMIRFTDCLRSRRYPGLDMEVVVYPDEYHATVPGVVLSHGVRRLLSGR